MIRTDGMGSARSVDAADGVEVHASLALAVDLLAAALGRAGELAAQGDLRSALVSFDGAIVAIGRPEGGGSVAVVGEPDTLPGLVLGQLHRILAETRGGGTER